MSWFGVNFATFVFNPNTYSPTGASSLTFPSFARMTTAALVNIFVVEPSRNNISGRTASFVSTLATPNPFAYISLRPLTIPIAHPGIFFSNSSALAIFSNSAKSGSAPRAAGDNAQQIKSITPITLTIDRMHFPFNQLGLPPIQTCKREPPHYPHPLHLIHGPAHQGTLRRRVIHSPPSAGGRDPLHRRNLSPPRNSGSSHRYPLRRPSFS